MNAYYNKIKKAPSRIRTGDLRITNALLYQLSHGSFSFQTEQFRIVKKLLHFHATAS